MKLLGVALCALALAAVASVAQSVPPQARADVDTFLRELEATHPNPYHSITREELQAAAGRLIARLPELDGDGLLVELMRLVAMLGEREGHSGIWVLANHRRPLHFYGLHLHHFSDGVFVTATVRQPSLVGARVLAVAGRPVEEVLALVGSILTRDNSMNVKAAAPNVMLAAEVLHGLGVTPTAARATFTLQLRSGERRDVELRALTQTAYLNGLKAAFPSFVYALPKRTRPLFVRHRGAEQRLTTLNRGRVAYLAYNSSQHSTLGTADRLRTLLRTKQVTRVIVDLRLNGGGEISTYSSLLRVLRSKAVNQPRRLVVLISRFTFSAAVHFAADVRRWTRAVFLGEPTGGSPNHYSDCRAVDLPYTGYVLCLPTVRYEKFPRQNGLTLEPDVRIDLSAADFFAGRDPVLAAALALR